MSTQRSKDRPTLLTRGAAVTSLAALGLAGLAAPARGDDAVALAHVAHQLGFHYAFLPFENAVSLARPGAIVVVRPGDAFFTVNERREPVFGMVPQYRGNDIYVSSAFVGEIRGLGRPFAPPPGRPAFILPPNDVAGHVTQLHLSQTPNSPRIRVTGSATPGARIDVVLRADLSASLPIVVLDRATAIADASGAFATVLHVAPDNWYASRFVVDAFGTADAAPMTAEVDREEQNTDAHTIGDDFTLRP